MPEVLQNKNSGTRFQILVEVAAAGPNVQQKQIAATLGITPQAVSDYFRQMLREGLLLSDPRAGYRVSAMGVNWMLKMLRELNDYTASAGRAVTNITVCAAIAEQDLERGQAVSLTMKDGLLFASPEDEGGAKGVAVSTGRRGEDVDISHIEGLVDFLKGKVTIAQVPSITQGGSKKADIKRLRSLAGQARQVGAVGIEALVAVRKAGLEPSYRYGVAEAAVEAAHCGLSFLIVATSEAIPKLEIGLQSEAIDYHVEDLALK
ncbi:MAG: winged helix-turn-helix transcriptional regulator [Chloroflexi bacterium]|nr:winged helix-turn-helix transcriptional regulator [Chloroflexota bacterium]